MYRMFVALLISKPSKNSVSVTILLSCKGLIFDFNLNRKRNKCWLAAHSWDLFTYQFFGRNASWLITRLCQLCYKYCGTGRYRLSIVFRQIAGWLWAENFENSVWKSAEQIPVRVLQWFSQTQFACFGSTRSTIVMSLSSLVNCTVYLFLVLGYFCNSR